MSDYESDKVTNGGPNSGPNRLSINVSKCKPDRVAISIADAFAQREPHRESVRHHRRRPAQAQPRARVQFASPSAALERIASESPSPSASPWPERASERQSERVTVGPDVASGDRSLHAQSLAEFARSGFGCCPREGDVNKSRDNTGD